MKNKHILYIACAGLMAMTACKKDSFLNRAPLSNISPQTFFTNETDFQLYCNQYYKNLPVQTLLRGDFTSDDKANQTLSTLLAGTYTIPNAASATDLPGTGAFSAGATTISGTGTNWNFAMIRSCNFFLANYGKAALSDSIKNEYVGETLFFRANEFWKKVKAFGDVPYINVYITDTSKSYLYGPRMPHAQVMDSVLSDLTFAVNHLPVVPSQTGRITKYAALALMARVCLWEATYRKYNNGGDPTAYFAGAVSAAEQLMGSGKFSIYNTGHPKSDYYNLFIQTDLSTNTEAILPFIDLANILTNDIDRQLSQNGDGYSKDFARSFLCTDGLPYSLSPLYKGDNTPDSEAMNRDPRYAQEIATRGFNLLNGDTIGLPRVGTTNTSTGYQCIKGRSSSSAAYNAGQSTQNFFVFRYAETLLIEAEAKAELGQCTQTILDNTINKLRDRAGMPHMIIASLVKDPKSIFPALPVLLDEIRRERRVELASENFRWDDLKRWNAGPLISNPETILGMKLTPALKAQYLAIDPKSPVVNLVVDANNYIRVYPSYTSRVWDPKLYLYPIPTQELTLNPGYKQNPGW